MPTTKPTVADETAPKEVILRPRDIVNEEKKTLTNWGSLKNFSVKEIICSAYAPFHKVDNGISCHSRLRVDPQQVLDHVLAEHAGGFQVVLEKVDKTVPFWNGLSERDLEASDFRCEVCDKQIPFQINHILPHMKAHTGKSKRIREGGRFNFTLRIGNPTPSEVDSFEENG